MIIDDDKKWKILDRLIRIAEFLIILFGVCFTIFQMNEILNNQHNRENDLILRYEDRMEGGKNSIISMAIEHNQSILKNGKITSDDLDNYLGTIEDIDTAHEKGLISDKDVYENFSDEIIRAYKNIEIQKYLKIIRVEDETYFQGFDDIALYEIQESSQYK